MLFLLVASLLLLFGTNLVLTTEDINKTAIGIIIKPGEEITLEAVRRSFYLNERVLHIHPHPAIEIFTEIVSDGNAVELDKAVCRLLNNGIQALIATTTPFSYRMLLPYSNDYNLPLVSPAFPEISPESVAHFGVSVKPSTTRAVLDLIRYYGWKDIVYLYDSDDGPERLQQIFLLGYRVLKTRLIGILKVNQSEEAQVYIRKLDYSKNYRNLHVILDMKAELAREIIVRHVHDFHVGKSNFHFLMTDLVFDEFWTQNTTEMGSVKVTGFRMVLSNNTAAKHFYSFLRQSIKEISGQTELPASAYYAYDAALVLSEAFGELYRTSSSWRSSLRNGAQNTSTVRSCLTTKVLPSGQEISRILKEMELTSGITGKIRFGFTGTRKNYGIDVIETNPTGYTVIAQWTDTYGLKTVPVTRTPSPSASPRVDSRKRIKITSVLNPPYLMTDIRANNTLLKGRNVYFGFIKDLMELLAREMDFDYEINLSADGRYGTYDESAGKWSGAIGEVIRGVADMAAADIIISGPRQKVVEFTEPFEMLTLSLLMKNPASLSFSSPYFIFSSFAGNVWICILAAAIFVAFLLYTIGKFTGSPDSIQSASGLWGKKFTPVNSLWFTSGSMLLQSTGVYPRSISSRILGAAWWCFTLIMLALFIANITCQMHMERLDTEQNPETAKLKSLSLESIIAESVERGWPVIGLRRAGTTEKFVRASSLSTYKNYAKFLDSHPEAMVQNPHEGAQRVRQSNGGFALLTESSKTEYISNTEPCDTIMIHDSAMYAGIGIAVRKGSLLKVELNEALRTIRRSGEMAYLHRKWWIEGSPCLKKDFLKQAKESSLGLRSMSGIFYVILICLGLTAVITAAQYFWRVHKREERRRKVSFEDMTLGQSSLPLPPPELLSDPPIEEDSGIIDGWAERRLIPSSFGEPSK